MNSEEMQQASRKQLEDRMKELEAIPNVETTFPENLELQILRQMLVPGYEVPRLRRSHGVFKTPAAEPNANKALGA